MRAKTHRDETRMGRRRFLSAGAAAVGAAAAAPLLGSERAFAAADGALQRLGTGDLGLVGMDHVGLTVPDINQAIEWFEDILGAAAPLTFGPFAGDFLTGALGVVPGTKIDQITMLRIGHSANIELFKYESPGQRRDMPLNSDWTGHHVAFYVTDIEQAVEYMDSRGVHRLFGPFSITAGPAEGQTINYFKTPWNSYIEFISYPHGMAYQQPGVKPLWSPKENGLESVVTKVPGLLGIDHVGITVPNIAIAAQWLEEKLGFFNPLTFGPFADPVGEFMKQLVDVNPRAVVEQIRVLRGGNGPGIELFQYTSPDQDQSFRRNSDWGGHHVGLYVQSIERGVRAFQAAAGTKRDGPLTLTSGPAAGQSINYFATPFGTDVELISYPHGMDYEKSASIKLWNPKNN
jgi:catechol 2,3-dioxygenase-like lactoylglutathione lyase family enzyme